MNNNNNNNKLNNNNNNNNNNLLLTLLQDLHVSSIPKFLLEREEEKKIILNFWKNSLENKKSGCIYISGSPGTGKTALISEIKNEMIEWERNNNKKFKSTIIEINCMELKNPTDIFKNIAQKLKISCFEKNNKELSQLIKDKLCNYKRCMKVFILDEIDQLISNQNQLLYQIFEWTVVENSSLILFGIANSLDLTERFLPYLQTINCNPILLNFQRYNKDQIFKILTERLNRSNGFTIFDSNVIQLIATKIGNHSGDIRKALNICRKAVEDLQIQFQENPNIIPKVTFPQIQNIIEKVLGSSKINLIKELELHPKMVLTSALLALKSNKYDLSSLWDFYQIVCKKGNIIPIPLSSFKDVCECLQDQYSLISIQKPKGKNIDIDRFKKVLLNIEPKELIYALQDCRPVKITLESL